MMSKRPDGLLILVLGIERQADIAQAVDFYCRVFDIRKTTELEGGSWHLEWEGIVLHLNPGANFDEPHYEPGKTPRLELVVDDVDDYLQRASEAGAHVKVCLVEDRPGHLQERRMGSDDDRPTAYAHIIDPFGHLWAFARARDRSA